ncbi:MAG: CHAT domain-containing protein [Cyanobacteria bacterium J06623_7]
MLFKLRQRIVLLFLFATVGLSMGLLSNPRYLSPVLATAPPSPTSLEVESATELEAKGKYFYAIAQYQSAASFWQRAIETYDPRDSLNRARLMSSLALAQGQLNNWSQAIANIDSSLALLQDNPDLEIGNKVRALAQVYNNQGILLLDRGKKEAAIASWQQAKDNYRQAEDELGVIRASINQASAFKQLGHYRRAVKTLAEVETALSKQSDSTVKLAGLKSYGDMLWLVGEVEPARKVLQEGLIIAERLESVREKIELLLALGNTYKAHYPERALTLYQRGWKICQQQQNCRQTDLPLQIQLAKLNTWLATPHWRQGKSLIPQIASELKRLPINRVNIDRHLNFAHSLVELNRRAPSAPHRVDQIEQLLAVTREQAKQVNYPRAQSYSWGLQGQIREEQQNWSTARQYTQKALVLAQSINAPEVSYLWQWQLGRIDRALGEREGAVIHYTKSVELLESLSRDLVAIDPDVQYSFRDSVEPVYRGLVSLLLEPDGNKNISQVNLEEARKVIESLQLAELNNFFREACLDAQVVNIDNVDRQAAVIYPIVLSDRLEIILSLPNQPLKHYSKPISRTDLEGIIARFRHNIVIRSRRNFYHSSQRLYNLIIRPALEDLSRSQIKTLVFVPDGALRNVPLSALYDGRHFLIEDYSIALTPGLQLLNPRPLEQAQLKTIAAGLTEEVDGFAGLDFVNSELQEIESRVNSRLLVDRDFTAETLKKEIQYSDYPIVHIATHGQFSSSIEDTFLLAWNERININELDRILQTRNHRQEHAIELLVLSACETATGDSRAALGLAGMAVRAGAKSTLATLWSVNDRATAKLMSDFYRELSEKHLPKAEAVRQAQLSLLHNRWYKHPFYWAPYVLLGNWL